MKTLIIAEKPELGRAIANAIEGNTKEVKGVIVKKNVVITWAYGHLLRLMEPDEYDEKYRKWRKEDLPICFDDWRLVPDGNKKDRVQQIMQLMEECDQIIHAGDPDDEGQFLIDEILWYAQNKKPVKRVYINDNTPANIKKAFHQLVDNDESLMAIGRSAYARAVADYVVGINYSRLFSIVLKRKGLSVGRVQSPTLGLIVSRDEQIEQHIKQTYYELEVHAQELNSKQTVTFMLKPSTDFLEGEKHILHADGLLELQTYLTQYTKQKMKVVEKSVEVRPPLPFNLAKLQAHMNQKYGFDLSKTDKITQTLRDKYQAITYNRSDSQYLKEEHYQEANKVLPFVMEKLKVSYPIDYTIHSECFNDKYVTAHHAIIPTMSNFKIEALLPDERKVYEEICHYYFMQFLPSQKKRQVVATISCSQGELKAVSTFILDEGYRQYFQEESEKDSKKEEKKFDLKKGMYEVDIVQSKILEKQTNPPKRYTQASLIRDMTSIAKYVKDKEIKEILKKKDKGKKGENGSIGTSATRSQIVETLLKRGYVEMKGRQIISTQLGREFYHILPDEMKGADLTAKWWLIQEDIKEGKAEVKTLVQSVLDAFCPHLTKDYSRIKVHAQVDEEDQREAIGICPVCGHKIVDNGKGYGCANYYNGCRFAIWKEDRFFVQLGKTVRKEMVRKLLKDGYCLVKVKEDEQEVVKVLQMGIQQGRCVYRLLDDPRIHKKTSST